MKKCDFKKTNLLIIYPWDDVLNCSCGATLRLTLLIQFLKRFFDNVTVIYPNNVSKKIDNINYISFRQTKINIIISRMIRKAIKLFYKFFYSEELTGNELNQIWQCFRFRYDKKIKKTFHIEIAKADIIIMKYFYFSSLVFPEVIKNNKKIIVTDYDVVAEQAEKKHIKEKLLKMEISALKRANIPVVLSDNDRDYFKRKGINNLMTIYNGIDTTKASKFKLQRGLIRNLLEIIYNIIIDEKDKVCFFIGSGFIFNVNAAERIAEISINYSSLFPDSKVKFIVCGSCHKKCLKGDFISIGFAESFLIHLLYLLSDIVLIPLEKGTGASLKTAEAFSYGKMIIGTNIAFRGISVAPGENCIVSDKIENYPFLIKQYIENEILRKKIEQNSLLLGKKMDYRNQNRPYLDIFDMLNIPYKKNQVQNIEDANPIIINRLSDIDVNNFKLFFKDSKQFFNKIEKYKNRIC